MKDKLNSPRYYNKYPIETIDMMISIFGVKKTINFCIMNAYKYRMRLGMKDDIEQDLKKEDWYLNKASELKYKNNSQEPSVSINGSTENLRREEFLEELSELN